MYWTGQKNMKKEKHEKKHIFIHFFYIYIFISLRRKRFQEYFGSICIVYSVYQHPISFFVSLLAPRMSCAQMLKTHTEK